MTINLNPAEARNFSQIFCCKIGEFPIKYLGVPLHYSKLRKEDLQPVIDKIIKKIGGWRGKLLNVRSKLTLIQSCIVSIPVHLLAVIKFPKWALNMINSQMSNFLWDDTEDGRKYYLANWDLICLKKEFSGLGVQNLRDYNLCLLASWIRRYHLDTNKILRQIVDYKYDLTPNILCVAP
jgi:hypothetical protein